jgi:hydrogen peroxide-dependent heme synthase
MSHALPALPLTVDGSAVLHQFFRLDWGLWNELAELERETIVAEARVAIADLETSGDGQSALYTVLGHKGDLLLIHFRPDFEGLERAQRTIDRLRLRELLEPTTSFLSVIELSLYESSVKVYNSLHERGIEAHSEEWTKEVQETLARQREAMSVRLFPELPNSKYVCFYPMDRRRGEQHNWYMLSIEERQQLMHVHGMNGRRYAGQVKQIISGAVGFDDWEWGVDLFSDEPLVFKKLITDLRFDPVSAVYADFGPFYIGQRLRAEDLEQLLTIS